MCQPSLQVQFLYFVTVGLAGLGHFSSYYLSVNSQQVGFTEVTILRHCIVRVASGIVVILREKNAQNKDELAAAAAALLGVGVYPLLLAFQGLCCIM